MKRRGFTLIELLVAMGLLALIVVGFLSLFDSSVKISKAQSATADVQENLRYVMGSLVKMSRMAGAGGLPAVVPQVSPGPRLGAVVVRNNVGVGSNPLPTFAGRTPLVGSDVLELRGAFTVEIFDIRNAVDPASSTGDYSYSSPTGQIVIPATSLGGATQNTNALDLRVDNTVTPPLWAPFVVSSMDTDAIPLANGRRREFIRYGVGIMTAKDTNTRTYTFTTTAATERQQAFLDLNPGGLFQSGFTRDTVYRVAVINDFVFFVANDDDGIPTLYQHDVLLDRNEPFASDIIDLQAELGCDLDVNGFIERDGDALADDEWLLNFPNETVADLADPGNVTAPPAVFYLRELQLTLASRIPAADLKYVQRPNGTGGRVDEFYFSDGRDLLADPGYRGVAARNYRHRWLTERVKLRSVGPIA